MEDNVKKSVMIGIAVLCLVLAVGITVMRSSDSGISDLTNEEIVLLKCTNSACGAEIEMGKKDFYTYAGKNSDINGNIKPMLCEECGRDTMRMAVKCEKCDTVFVRGSAGVGKLADTCPECGYSAEKERRKARRAAD